jgi:hypothetical protein
MPMADKPYRPNRPVRRACVKPCDRCEVHAECPITHKGINIIINGQRIDNAVLCIDCVAMMQTGETDFWREGWAKYRPAK